MEDLKGVIMNKGKHPDRRRCEREAFSTEAEIYLESSIYKTRLVDFSGNGVRFEMEKPIKVRVRFKIGEKRIDHMAQIVWSVNKEGGDNIYGFKFILDKEES